MILLIDLPLLRLPRAETAFDIAGKNRADASSFLAALFECIDIIQRRNTCEENRKNPLRKMTSEVLANAEDEEIKEQ